MRAALARTYDSRFFDVRSGAATFRGKANHAQLGLVGLSYCFYGAETAVQFPEADCVRLQIGLNGNAETQMGSRKKIVTNEQSCTIPTAVSNTTTFSEGFAQLVLRIDREALSKRLITLLGTNPSEEIIFYTSMNFSDVRAAQLRRLILFLANELDFGLASFSSVAKEIANSLVTAFLCSARHNFRDALDQPAKNAAPWQVSRAEAYIEANWNKAITIDALCAEISVSARSLYASFNKARSYSPMAFLKAVRLRHAQVMLQNPDFTTSVTQASLACGFYNLGHFAKDYRDAYGESPSETLKKAKIRI